MADDKDNKLLNEIKNYLEITWDDSLGDEKIRGMVKRGMAAISGKIGECNFYEETQEKALLLIMSCMPERGRYHSSGRITEMRSFLCR